MKPAKEIVFYRYLLYAALGLVLVPIAVYLAGMDIQKSCRMLLEMNNKINRIQAEASMHLSNYAYSGQVRDLQKFRSTSSPLVDLAKAVNEEERDGEVHETISDAFMQVGFDMNQVSRMNRISIYSRYLPFKYNDADSWEYAIAYHYRMFDFSRRLLRDHVHGTMTQQAVRNYIAELQALNQEIQEQSEIFQAGLVQYEQRIGKIIRWLLGGIVLIGFLFIGYSGYEVEKSLKAHERSLYHSRKRYQEMFEQAGIGVARTNPDGRLLWANPALARILGYDSVEDLYSEFGNFTRKFVDPERKEDFKKGMYEAGFVSNFMFRAYQKDQKKIWLLTNARSVKDEKGKLVCYEGSYQDYTLYRQTNQEMHYLTAILRGMAQSIYQLLLTPGYDEAIREMLKIMGMAGNIDRVYVYRNYQHGEKIISNMEYEWVKHDSLKVLNTKATLGIKWKDRVPDVFEKLEKGKVGQLATNELDGSTQKWLKDQKTRVIMLAPVYVGDDFWGVMGFDNCSNDDKWSNDITQVLKTIASALGHFIQKTKVQESLVESKDRYRTLVSTIREVVFHTDSEGIIRYLNPAWSEVLHYEHSNCINHSIFDYLHPDDREEANQALTGLVRGKTKNIRREFRLITQKGGVRWLEWNCLMLDSSNGGSPQIYGTMYDLTEYKKSESIMKRNNQQLEALIESSPMVITVTDTDGRITLWNRAAELTFGWKRNEVIGKPAPDVPDNQQEQHYDLLDRVLSGQQLADVELERKRKNGSRIHISMSASPLYDNNGRVTQVISFAQDISEAKVSKEAIRKSLKEKNVLLSEIHHRVKNNMAVISSLLSLKAQEQSDPAIVALLNESENRIKSMAMIHEKLYQTDTFAEVEFGSYLSELAVHIENHYEDAGTAVQSEVHADEIYLEITQAVPCGLFANEVITNCYKHAFAGRDKGNIHITLSMDGDDCVLYIKDDGVGLPDELLSGDTDDVSLGTNLIRGLSKQLKGELQMGNDHGTWIRLSFRLV